MVCAFLLPFDSFQKSLCCLPGTADNCSWLPCSIAASLCLCARVCISFFFFFSLIKKAVIGQSVQQTNIISSWKYLICKHLLINRNQGKDLVHFVLRNRLRLLHQHTLASDKVTLLALPFWEWLSIQQGWWNQTVKAGEK